MFFSRNPFKNKFLNTLANWFWYRPIDFIESYERFIAFRTYDKYHIINTRLSPGYHDKPEQIFHGIFSLLVDYVEIELASRLRTKTIPLFERICSWIPGCLDGVVPYKRSRIKGLKELNRLLSYHKSDVDKKYWTNQKAYTKQKHAMVNFYTEVKALYLFWKDIRPNYKDSEELVGLTTFTNKLRKKYGCVYRWENGKKSSTLERLFAGTKDESKKYNHLMKLCWQEDDKRTELDQTMLIRLIKIREYLWT